MPVGSKAVINCNSYNGYVVWLFEAKLEEGNTTTLNKSIEYSRESTITLASLKYHDNGHLYCFGQYSKKKLYFIAKVVIKIYGM